MDCYSWLSIQTGRNDGKVALTAHSVYSFFSLSYLLFDLHCSSLLILEKESLAGTVAYAHGISQRPRGYSYISTLAGISSTAEK